MGSRLGFRNKKAFIGDVLLLLIFMFIMALTILCAYLVLSNVNTAFQASSSIADAGKTIVSNSTSSYTSLWDGLFVFLLVGLSLASWISAYFIDTHPIMFVFMLMILAAYIFVGASIANAYWNVEAASAFSGFALNFKMMHYIMAHLPYYVMIEGAGLLLALFAKVNS